MVIHKNDHLNAKEDFFVTSLHSKLITYYMMFHFGNEIQINFFFTTWNGF
jgi:hypothetical protein